MNRPTLILFLAFFLAAAALFGQEPAPSTIWQTAGGSDYINLGAKLSLTSDLNQDGVADFLSRAPNADLGGHAHTGVLTAISGADGTHLWEFAGWLDQQFLGRHMALPGDLDGDQVDDFILGEPDLSINGLVENGRVTALRGSDGTILWQMLGSANHARLGESMASLGDIDGDGLDDLLFGMPLASTGILFNNGSVMAVSGAWGFPLWMTDGAANDELLGMQLTRTADFSGDAIADIISLSPDASSNGLYQNGILSVLSGANGTQLWRRDGVGSFEHMAQAAKAGADMNGDGLPEILLRAWSGSTAGFFDNGWVEMVSGVDGISLWHVDGGQHGLSFGESSIKIADVDLDGHADFALSAPGESSLGMIENGRVEGLSSATGLTLWTAHGSVNYGRLGTGLLALDDMNGDGNGDLLTGLSTGNTLGRVDNGYLQAISSSTGGLIWRKDGSTSGERLGTTILTSADFSGDGVSDLVLGGHLADLNGLFDNGEILGVDGSTGGTLWLTAGTETEELLGKNLATHVDMDGDGQNDLLAFSPFSDTQGLRDNGVVKAFSLLDGSLIWRHDGGRDGAHAGETWVSSFDHDNDSVNDLVLGSGFGDYGAFRGNGAIVALSAGRIQTLDILNLVAGSTATFQGSGFAPGASVSIFASLVGPGPTEVLPGFVVALSDPIHTIGSDVVDAAGNLTLVVPVPVSVAGLTAWFQAVQNDSGTYSNSNQMRKTIL